MAKRAKNRLRLGIPPLPVLGQRAEFRTPVARAAGQGPLGVRATQPVQRARGTQGEQGVIRGADDIESILEAMRPLAEVAIDIAIARLATASKQALAPDQGRLIAVEDAAKMAGVTASQFYRLAAFKPAVVKLGHRTLRVNEARLRRILDPR